MNMAAEIKRHESIQGEPDVAFGRVAHHVTASRKRGSRDTPFSQRLTRQFPVVAARNRLLSE